MFAVKRAYRRTETPAITADARTLGIRLVYLFPNCMAVTVLLVELRPGSAMRSVLRIYEGLYGKPRILQPAEGAPVHV